MADLNFPSSPTLDQEYTDPNGNTWIWNSESWVASVIGFNAATESSAGVVEVATAAEVNTGTDNTRVVTPDGLDSWTGSAQLVTVGAIVTSEDITTGAHFITEQATDPTSSAGKGIIFVDDTTPCRPMFMDDSGNKFKLDHQDLTTGEGLITTHKNLQITPDGTNPNYQLDVTADEVTVWNSTNTKALVLTSITKTLDITTSGLNGLDTGTEASSTWYYIWYVSNESGSTSGVIFSTSSTAPTMPSGTTYKGFLGAWYNQSSGHLYSMIQRNRDVQFYSYIIAHTTALTYYTAVGFTTIIPPNVYEVKVSTYTYYAGPNSTGASYLSINGSNDTTYDVGWYYNGNYNYMADHQIITLKTSQSLWARVSASTIAVSVYFQGWRW